MNNDNKTVQKSTFGQTSKHQHTKPYLFQREDAARIEQFGGRCLLSSEMGLGKTLTTLLWAFRNPEARPVIIVCPASIKWNWQKECATHFNFRAEILQGTRPSQGGIPYDASFYIINYDILGPWLPFLRSLYPKLIILDECHFCVNRKAKRSRFTKELCVNVPHVIAVSGTPLTNRPAELWQVLSIVRPDLYPNFFIYAYEFTNPRRKPWGVDYSGAANLDVLHSRLSNTMMIRRRKAEVLSQLPPKQNIVVPLEIENRKEYEAAERDIIAWLAKQSQLRAKRAARAEQLAKMNHLKMLAGKLKLKSVIGWIDSFLEESEEKIILFAVHKEIVHTLETRYKGQCTVVTGDVVGKQRQQAFESFVKNPKIRVFIGNTRAAGVGWSAKGCSTVAFVEMDWTPGIHSQCADRVHGIGRGGAGQSSIYYLIARDTLEEHLCQMIQKKQKILAATLDGGEGEDLPIFDQLMDALVTDKGFQLTV